MVIRESIRGIITRSSIAVVLFAAMLLPGTKVSAAEMESYCVMPPYVKRDVAPNIMFLMDNSNDMYYQAYTDAYTPNATKDNYIGYFIPQACYTYSGNKFVEQPKTGSISCDTAGCYTSYTYTDNCPSAAPFRGNLLNWATMSKYDVLQKVLIGGNSVSKQSNANTLLSIGGSWSKTYNGCVFSVNNANLTLTETSPGACALLDNPAPSGFAFRNQQWLPDITTLIGEWLDKTSEHLSSRAKGMVEFAANVWDNINLVSEAEAATGVGILSGSLNGTIGSPYSITFQCTGSGTDCPNNATYNWTITGKPAWLTTTTYQSSGSKINYRITLSGTPLATGSFGPFTVSFTAGTKSASASFTIVITASALAIINSSPLPAGTVCQLYAVNPYSSPTITVKISGSGGVSCGANPYTWSAKWCTGVGCNPVTNGMPAGLSLNSTNGEITGTPNTDTGSPFTVRITMRDCDTPARSVSKDFSLTINAAPLSITTAALPDGVVSSSYPAQTLTGAGGSCTGGYTWAITSGYLPFGLFLDPATGVISGNTCPFIGSGANGYGWGTGAGIQTGHDWGDGAGVRPIQCLKTDQFTVVNGHSYAVTACAADGGDYTGDTWLQLTGVAKYYNDDSCGVGTKISFSAGSTGTETLCESTYYTSNSTWKYNIIDTTDNRQCQGTFNFTVSLTDNTATTVTKNLSITIGAGALTIVTSGLPNAAKGLPYSYTVQGTGGTPLYTWSATGLPGSLSINATTGEITGTPAASEVGTYTVTITLRDSAGATVSKTFNLEVVRNLALRSNTYNVKVDIVEEPIVSGDLNGNDIYDPNVLGESYTDLNGNGKWDGKKGVFQQYWDELNPRARWGLTKYSNRGVDVTECIPASPASSFYTAIQNATPENSAPLASGLYGDINYYGFNGTGYVGCNNADPIDDVKCRKNFVLIISSGANLTGTAFTTNPDGSDFSSDDCPVKPGREANRNEPLVQNACYGFRNDMRPGDDKPGKQNVITFAVHTMGSAASGAILEDAAVFSGGGKYYEATNPENLERQLDQAFKDMLARAASGTAASVLASGEGSGANLVQAVFYPRRKFGFDEVTWTGRLTNLWYYVDPNLNNSSIREDDGILDADGAPVLTLKTDQTSGTAHHDNVVQLFFDNADEVTKAHRWKDADGNSVIDLPATLPDVEFESIGKLWEAGKILWSRDLTASPRTLYTSETGTGLIPFSTANRTRLRPYLQAASDTEAEAIIRYVHGEDTVVGGGFSPALAGFTNSYRPRSVSIDGEGPHTWKLGDVLNSTPKISSWLPLNTYHKMYGDATYGVPGKDPSLHNAADANHYITSTGYRGRNMIYTGGNDGMLHAFRLGTLELPPWTYSDGTQNGDFDKARLTGSGLGEEVWAYIPKNALPYLKYIANLDYCHVYAVDLTPFIFDASIGAPADGDLSNTVRDVSHWRTILIGGMRFGGACKPKNDTCSTATPNGVCAPAEVSGASVGYSSYFALDITDQDNPILLWEKSSAELPGLGFTTAGPAIVRVSAQDSGVPNRNKNGKWFVVLGSGPTGPIDTSASQFLGHSDQNLQLYILDLKSGTLKRTIDTGVQLAFAGSMFNTTLDTDLNYSDDVVYIPFTKDTGDGTWTNGGVLRLSTKEDPDPANWAKSLLIDNVGPVTAAVTKLVNRDKGALWTFFGTGRYFFEQTAATDDAAGHRLITGIKDPCYSSAGFDPSHNCTTSRSLSDLIDVTDINNVPTNPDDANFKGWFIQLDASGVPDGSVFAERVITDPVATTSGVVFFTTLKPYTDTCNLGGLSSIWAVKYNSGGDASALLRGQALIQVSTGSIEQLRLSDAFRDSVTGLNTGNRKTLGMEGVPPTAQGLSIISSPAPVKRVMHVKER